jgi:hypothetical protein
MRISKAMMAAASASLLVLGCTSLHTRRVVFERHPIAVTVVSDVIDEETLEYSVRLRNVGRDVVSFDYSIADEPSVPHIDHKGPNSGLVKNLYPGVEVEVPNPMNTLAVWVTLGTVTYGKRSDAELDTIYNAEEAFDAPPGSALDESGLLPEDSSLLP